MSSLAQLIFVWYREGGKDVKRGAQVAANKVQGLWEEEAAPNYGFLGWRHVSPLPRLLCMRVIAEPRVLKVHFRVDGGGI